ncbi:MAG: hypothetical protein ACYSUB_01710 [Planctomycetota bacterium]|jgi:hypothetical protein
MQLIPLVRAVDLPDEVLEYCVDDSDWPTHYESGIVQVTLRDGNVMAMWLEAQGYEFSPSEIKRGWGYIALEA